MNHRLLRILLAFIPALLGAYFFYRQVQSTRVNEVASNSPEVQSGTAPQAAGGLDARHDSLVMRFREELEKCMGLPEGAVYLPICIDSLIPRSGLTDFKAVPVKAVKSVYELRLEHLGTPSKGFYVLTGVYIVWYDSFSQKYRRADGIPGEPPRLAVPL